ncbi:F390 synthetase-related protein [Saccharibacillus alkalitolerans]|uniref:Adenylate cyclase n=1 Tax=Saccharibacillus alkalitolerans TaxID=2705290 RepID=A0ABX0F7E3_9BACL|nr:F390 synthetase-related protein [Saccharibacillus alkalitolerans]NGZ76300.1 adenylate cyclase [Saccharibacillus alkalitolerans]
MNTDSLHIVLQYAAARRRAAFRDRESLERWREPRIVRHLEEVRSRSPFYRELWEGRDVQDWRRFPQIDKKLMMDRFDALNTAGIRREDAMNLALEAERTRDFTPEIGGLTIGLSSGTSGSRGLFLVSRQERLAWTGTILQRVLPGSLLQRHNIAFFLRADSNLYGSVRSRRVAFEFYDLLHPLERHVARLNAQRPSVLAAPPSMLRLLAEEARAGRLKIAPGHLVSMAEVLDPLDQKIIEETFGRRVYQVYQCTEGFLGASCSHGTLHLNEDVVHIEKDYVDEKRRTFVPIVTDFVRFAQPIVRYRLGDLLTEREAPCPCGSPFTAVERIEGRSDDLYVLPARSGSGFVTLFPDFVSRTIIGASADIEAYRAVLHAPDRLTLELDVRAEDKRPEIEEAVRRATQHLCERIGARKPEITFKPYAFVPGGTKLRRVQRRFAVNERMEPV